MKKLISLMMLAALTSGAAVLTENQSFAGPRPSASHAHRVSRVSKETGKVQKTAGAAAKKVSSDPTMKPVTGKKKASRSKSRRHPKLARASRAKRGLKTRGVRKVRHTKRRHRPEAPIQA